jgi:hypothetical protein
MLTGGTLSPVYGRDYTKRAAIVEDLNKGLDFNIDTYSFSGLCSVRDLADGMYQVRDRSKRKVWSITIKSGVAK